jgi:dual specificity protein kinase YAK1
MTSDDPLPTAPEDDEEGFLIAPPGTQIYSPSGRVYTIVRELGKGQFGHIFETSVLTPEGQFSYAIKIQRSALDFRALAEHESKVLCYLQRQTTPQERMSFLQIMESFLFGEHFCMVVELLGMNLLDVLMRRPSYGLPIRLLQVATRDLFEALVIFRRCRVVHGDLKPENLVVCDGEELRVKVIDFGQARLITELYDGDLQTLYYRAPEIVLGIPYAFPIDMWSAGCIIAELFLGLPLFGVESEFGLLHAQIAFLGRVPRQMVENAARRKEFFLMTGDLKSEARYCADRGYEIPKSEPYFRETTLEATIKNHSRRPGQTTIEDIEVEAPARAALVDLLQRILVFMPDERITPEEGLRHPFLATDWSG